MDYKQLKKIVEAHISIKSDILPINSFDVANNIHLRVKNSIECKKDTNAQNYLLKDCDATYALVDGQYTIYYDESYPYKNFAVAHEISHHLLGNTKDGIEYHHDAQLMAAIIVAPIHLIKKHKIKSALQLAEQCKIPIDVAESYWLTIFPKSNVSNVRNSIIKYGIVVISTSVLISVIFSMIYANNLFFLNTNTNKFLTNQNVEETTEYFIDSFKNSESKSEFKTEISETEIITEITSEILNNDNDIINENLEVFVTKTGKKYHKEGCKYIKNKTNIFKISIKNAQNLDYTPCSVCF